MQYEIRNRTDLEMLGELLASKVAIPSNVLLLLIMDPHDFERFRNELKFPGYELEGEEDRFIYTTAAGIEFGVKRRQ
jgi:hypothetical protein